MTQLDDGNLYVLSADQVRRLQKVLIWAESMMSRRPSPPAEKRPDPLAMMPVRFGKVTADWDVKNPNEIMVNPCNSDGQICHDGKPPNNLTPITTTLYIVLPPDDGPAYSDIKKGDIVAYVNCFDGEAQLVAGLIVGRLPAGMTFAVALTQDGGSNSTSPTTGATWTYTVKDILGNVMSLNSSGANATGVDPTASPHLFRRPVYGQMVAATAGTAYYKSDGTLVVVWVNEAPGPKGCS